jgi:dipeptidase D
MGRLLKEISKEIDFNLASLNGGSKNNAIPREAEAVLLINSKDENKLVDLVRKVGEELKNEFRKKDPDLNISLVALEKNMEKVFSDETTSKVINLLYMYPNGVNTISADIEGLTESSTNLGVVTTTGSEVEFDSAVRSSVFSLREEIVERIKCITEILGGTYTANAGYPAWPYRADSKIRDICKEVYSKMYGKEPEVVAIHAGVECGILEEKLGNLDMVSFGPDIIDIHTPNEHMSISSVRRCYEYLLETLKSINS